MNKYFLAIVANKMRYAIWICKKLIVCHKRTTATTATPAATAAKATTVVTEIHMFQIRQCISICNALKAKCMRNTHSHIPYIVYKYTIYLYLYIYIYICNCSLQACKLHLATTWYMVYRIHLPSTLSF